jgi:hypothetical protein
MFHLVYAHKNMIESILTRMLGKRKLNKKNYTTLVQNCTNIWLCEFIYNITNFIKVIKLQQLEILNESDIRKLFL